MCRTAGAETSAAARRMRGYTANVCQMFLKILNRTELDIHT